MAKPLADLTKDELYELATKLQISGRSALNRQQLLEAIEAAQSAQDAQAKAAETAAPDGEGPPAEPEQELSQDEYRKIVGAKTDELEAVAQADLPNYLRTAVEAELQARRDKVEASRKLSAAQTPIERYVVTKGGRYVTKEAYVTTLPAGSMLTPYTHDLLHVKQQGIEFKPVSEVRTEADQLGNPITVIQ